MELHELQILQHGPCPVGHRQTVAGGHGGIRGPQVHLADAARREDHGTGGNRPAATAFQRPHARAPPLLDEQVRGEAPVRDRDAGVGLHETDEGRSQLRTDTVAASPEDAAPTVSALVREREPAPRPVKPHAPADQLADAPGSLVDEDPDRLGSAEAAPGADRVGRVGLPILAAPERHGDAALRVGAVALVAPFLVEQQDAAGPRGFKRGPQTGHASADDHDIG